MFRLSVVLRIAVLALLSTVWSAGWSQEVRHFRFAYDQPKNTGYSIAADIFTDKLKEFSKGTMLIDQYPGAQLGQEPQVLQLMKSGDIDFCISAAANAATLSPQAGVMSLHYLFLSEDHLKKAVGAAFAIDPNWPETVLVLARKVILDQRFREYPDARRSALTWARLGIRFIESPQPIHLDTVGLCHAGNGDFARAAEQSRWALLLSPGGPWGSVHRDRLRDYERKHLPWED